MDMFVAALIFLIVGCIIIHLYTRQVQQQVKDTNYRGFQQTYLIVYLLAVGKDDDWRDFNVGKILSIVSSGRLASRSTCLRSL